eukprot:8084169-Alexandrium_andersonii.AAC.1
MPARTACSRKEMRFHMHMDAPACVFARISDLRPPMPASTCQCEGKQDARAGHAFLHSTLRAH